MPLKEAGVSTVPGLPSSVTLKAGMGLPALGATLSSTSALAIQAFHLAMEGEAGSKAWSRASPLRTSAIMRGREDSSMEDSSARSFTVRVGCFSKTWSRKAKALVAAWASVCLANPPPLACQAIQPRNSGSSAATRSRAGESGLICPASSSMELVIRVNWKLARFSGSLPVSSAWDRSMKYRAWSMIWRTPGRVSWARSTESPSGVPSRGRRVLAALPSLRWAV